MTGGHRDICVVTGSRADFGLLRPLLEKIREDEFLNLQLVVTGAHLSARYGLTVEEIIAAGFEADERVTMDIENDSRLALAQAAGVPGHDVGLASGVAGLWSHIERGFGHPAQVALVGFPPVESTGRGKLQRHSDAK